MLMLGLLAPSSILLRLATAPPKLAAELTLVRLARPVEVLSLQKLLAAPLADLRLLEYLASFVLELVESLD